MSLSHTALNEEYSPPGAGVSLSSLFRSLARAKENALLTIAATALFTCSDSHRFYPSILS